LFGGVPLGPVCCGLHIGLIDWVILFCLGRGGKRHVGMPSWGWAGWIGEAFVPYPLFGSIQRLVMWELEHCPAAITHFKSLWFMDMPEIKHVLRVRTLAANLLLDPQTLDSPGFEHPLWMLRDCRGHVCGYVFLHDSTFWDAFPLADTQRTMLAVEVLALSDTLPGQGRYPHLGSDITYDPESREGPRKWQVAPFTGFEGKVRTEFGEQALDQYNVLIVLPRSVAVGDQRYSGFHEKIGVGVIHNQSLSWAVESAPSWKEFLIL
jgi:hypothetical protein